MPTNLIAVAFTMIICAAVALPVAGALFCPPLRNAPSSKLCFPPADTRTDQTDSSFVDLLQRVPAKFSADIVGGLRAMDCETLKAAEQTQANHMGLLLVVRTLAPAPSLCAPFDY